MKNLNLHRPIGLSETRKGLSLSVSDLLRKTSSQNIQDMELNSKLVDMFKQGLTEVEEDKLLDFVPLRMSNYRDLTDLDTAYTEARAYIRSQFEAFQLQKQAEAQRRLAAQQRLQPAPASQEQISTPDPTRVETPSTTMKFR